MSNHNNTFHIFQIRPLESGHLKKWEYQNNYISFACVFLFRSVSSTEFPLLENRCKNIIREKQAFERLEVKKEILLDMFKVNL